MTFVFLIATDTVRSVRQHRVVLAFVLIALAGMALVATGIRSSTRRLTEIDRITPHAPVGSPMRGTAQTGTVVQGGGATPAASAPVASGPAAANAEGAGPVPSTAVPSAAGGAAAHGAADPPDARELDTKIRDMTVMLNGFFAGAMSLLGSLLSLVLFCTVVSSEVRTGTIRVTLAKPVPRWAYLVGKWLGAANILAAYCLVSAIASAVLGIGYDVQGMGLLASAPWLSFCGSLVLGAVGLLYSLFVRAPVAGVLAWFTSATWWSWFPPVYAVLPTYQPFDVWQLTMLGTPVSPWSLVLSTLYAADVVIILLLIALARFRRMEIA